MAEAFEGLRADFDGLPYGDLGRWAETKYRLISLYDRLFSTGMKNKWDRRVYIDLYSGSGFGRIRGTEIYLKGSPLLALDVPDRYDKYIFCEENADLLSALRTRTEKLAPGANVAFVAGSCDSEKEKICAEVLRESTGRSTLSLCFVDPFDFGLKFETFKRIAAFRVDFLVLLAVGMDANRAYDHYVDGNNPKLDEAFGNTAWRGRWKSRGRGRDEFLNFVAEEFALSMSSLGYLENGPKKMKLVRGENNAPLYYLALFSKHHLAYKFWDEVLRYSTDQTSLW